MNEEKKEEQDSSELEKCIKKRDEYFAGWQREKADFINYKQRELERLEEVLSSAKENIFFSLLPVLDNYYLAARNIPKTDLENKSVKGLLLIGKQLDDAIKAMGIEEMKCDSATFDPALHEAIGEEEAEGVEPGKIIEIREKGYQIGNKVLRPAKVKVSK